MSSIHGLDDEDVLSCTYGSVESEGEDAEVADGPFALEEDGSTARTHATGFMSSAYQQQHNDHGNSTKKVKKSNAKKNMKKKQHSLDHLQQRVSELMATFEEHGWFVPPAQSMSEKGKVKSNRNYGADKKRQRKNTQRQLLENRIRQLEMCLQEEHGIVA